MGFLKGEVAVNKAIKTVLPLLAIAALCIVPFVSNNYVLTVLTTIMTTALLSQSWNILSGYGGQFSFGQAIFYGIGAYTAVILYTRFGITPWLGAVVGMGIAMLIGVIIGYLTFYCKIKGDYFALATLAFAEIFRLAVYNSTSSSIFGLTRRNFHKLYPRRKLFCLSVFLMENILLHHLFNSDCRDLRNFKDAENTLRTSSYIC